MGWAHCGQDSQGRDIGYGVEAVCDHPGCTTKIDRGLSYVCGDMHGEDEWSCEKYFCTEHRTGLITEPSSDQHGRVHYINVCKPCEAIWRKENPEEARALDEE